MAKFRYLSESERKNILKAYKEGVQVKFIAKSHNVNTSTIYRIINGVSKLRNGTGGRKRITSDKEDAYIRTTLKRNKFNNITEIQRSILTDYSVSLIRQRMDEAGMKLVNTRVKPILKRNQRRKRVEFIKQYKDRSLSFWRSIYFTDECMLRDEPWAFKRKAIGGDYLPKDCIPATRKWSHPSQLMCWFGIKYNEPVLWRPISGTLNSDKFSAIIKSVFADRLKQKATGKVVILQDNAPCHVSSMVNLFC